MSISVKGEKLAINLERLLIDKDREQAERFIQKAQFLDPKCAQAYREVALLALLAQKPDLRLEYPRKAAEAESDNPSLLGEDFP